MLLIDPHYTHTEFLELVRIKNPKMYDELEFLEEYSSYKKILARNKYGEVRVPIQSLFLGCEVSILSAINKTEYYINMAIEKHGDRYSYEKTKYLKMLSKVIITCKIHGDFEQVAISHINKGSGCPICAQEKHNDNRRMNKEWFISQSKKAHGEKYDYSNVNYTNITTKVCIICDIHGEFWQTPTNHINTNSPRGCPYCAGRSVNYINMISTVRPDLVKYFINKHQADSYTVSSNKEINSICPTCGSKKIMKINTLSKQGFNCKFCSDGISLPEKFLSNILRDVGIEFISQYSPDWANKKRYDFYIPSMSMIIEVHGEQHYDKTFESCGGASLKETIENDKIKMENAIMHVDKYMVIDCRVSEIEFLKKSIKESLSNIINLEPVDFDEIWARCTPSIKIIACDMLRNSGNTLSSKEISLKLNLSIETIRKYLKHGHKIGLCDYEYSKKYNKNNQKNKRRL